MDVIVLAGGLGTRLRSVVSELPKCMAPVAGRPFLYYLLKNLPVEGVTKVVLSVGYLREKIFDWVETVREEFPFAIGYAVEESPLGTGGGIRRALGCCTSETVAVLNGDTFFDADLLAAERELLRARARVSEGVKPLMAVALKPMKDFDRYGSVEASSEGVITAFREKCPCSEGAVNGGVYVAVRQELSEVLSAYPEKFSFESDFLQRAAEMQVLRAFRSGGYFIDIGIPEAYRRAQGEFRIASGIAAFEGVPAGSCNTLFLDRDGVINRLRPADYVKTWEEFEFLPGVLQAFAGWSRVFRHIVVVSNQRGVGRGLMSREDLDDIHRKMRRRIEAAGGRLDGIYVCTAVSDDDPRRKPNTGMLQEVAADFRDLDLQRSVMIGDSAGDAEFAGRAGIGRFILIAPEV